MLSHRHSDKNYDESTGNSKDSKIQKKHNESRIPVDSEMRYTACSSTQSLISLSDRNINTKHNFLFGKGDIYSLINSIYQPEENKTIERKLNNHGSTVSKPNLLSRKRKALIKRGIKQVASKDSDKI